MAIDVGLEQDLAKIRPHTSSNLPHQKTPAQLLQALEATFKEQSTQASPAAYFAALTTTLDSTIQKEKLNGFSLGEGDVLPAELYLLALTAPHVPSAVVRANLNTFLSLTAHLWPKLLSHAPPLRSQLSLYNAVFRALDRSQLELQPVRQSFAFILQLCLDQRPKVRKRAIDLVADVLAMPPTPLLRHPFEEKVVEWLSSALGEAKTGVLNLKKTKNTSADAAGSAIHLLACLRQVHPYIHPSLLPDIISSSLALPALGNQYLSQSVFSVLSDILSTKIDEDVTPQRIEQAATILKVLLSSAPLKTDSATLVPWLQVVGSAVLAYSAIAEDACSIELLTVWKAIFPYLESENPAVRKETAGCLASIIQSIPSTVVQLSARSPNEGHLPHHIIKQISKALESLSLASATVQLFSVISLLLLRLQEKIDDSTSRTAAEILMLPMVVKIGDMRIKTTFQHKEGADDVLRTAVSVMGPHVVLNALPLNLEPSDRLANREPRAFLLPLLTSPHHSPLSHFLEYFVPLTERMFDLQQKADGEGRASEAKVWSVLISQIWNGLPSYCHARADLREFLTPQFSQMLSHILYNQPDLRPAVLRALKIMVESNVIVQSEDEEFQRSAWTISREEASKNIEFLCSQAESWLAILFNVYTTVDRNGQGSVGDVISAWASITNDQVMGNVCKKVIELFQTNLGSCMRDGRQTNSSEESVVSTMQNILVLIVPYLPAADAQNLFNICIDPAVLTIKDTGIQKRGYKLLSKLVQSGKVSVDAEAILRKLEDLAENVVAAAKKDRLALLKALADQLPPTSLHVIPLLIPEAVLGTKESSEKARSAAFDFIIAMGTKMSQGGMIKRSQVDGMDEDDAEEVPATIAEYLTMMAGGLVGTTPHMASATVTAISRIAFEFKSSTPPEMQEELFTTILAFLSSSSREIVKSALGFIKLAIHTFPVERLRPHLKELVPALSAWSHDHKNHFKAKVRHIFERLIRRFGWDDVYAAVGEEDAGKVLLNIKKRKERAKRKKAAAAGDESEEDEDKPQRTTGDAFEDVLYGSESELDDSDEEHVSAQVAHGRQGGKKAKDNSKGARLRLDDDEPMDLLQDASTRVTFGQKSRRKPGQDAAKFKTDAETGKMIIDDSDSDSEDKHTQHPAKGEDVEGTAYRENITSADGFTRTPNGRIKFNKDTKKRRRENAEAEEDVEMGDAQAAGLTGVGVGAGAGGTSTEAGQKKAKRRSSVKLGHEFKAKNAGGDIKKGGLDPYAYLPLSQAAKKKHGRDRVSVTGKR